MAENDKLKHTAGGVTTRDGMDAGVPMVQGKPDEPVGPEDAFGPGKKRGDYSDRVDQGPHMVTEVIPVDEREEGGPIYRLVPAASEAGNVGDVAGKGGVSTKAAVEAVPTLAPTGPTGVTHMRETHEDGTGRAAAAADASASTSSSSSSSR